MKEVKCEKTMSCAPGFVWSWDCCCCTGWSGPINNLIEGFGTELKSPVSRYGCEKTMECAKGYKWSWTFCRCIVDGMPGPANKIAQGGILELNNPVTHLDGRRGEENPFILIKKIKNVGHVHLKEIGEDVFIVEAYREKGLLTVYLGGNVLRDVKMLKDQDGLWEEWRNQSQLYLVNFLVLLILKQER